MLAKIVFTIVIEKLKHHMVFSQNFVCRLYNFAPKIGPKLPSIVRIGSFPEIN